MKTHKDLNVWQKSIELVTEIYKTTKTFPVSEQYGLINQIRRSSVSIPSNIAEGAARTSKKEFAQFLSISIGSIAELETQLVISKNLNYIDSSTYQNLNTQLEEIRKMIIGLNKSIKK